MSNDELQRRFETNRDKIEERILSVVDRAGNASVVWGISVVLQIKKSEVPDHFIKKVAGKIEENPKYRKEREDNSRDYSIVRNPQYEIAELTRRNLELQNTQLKLRLLTFIIGGLIGLFASLIPILVDRYFPKKAEPIDVRIINSTPVDTIKH